MDNALLEPVVAEWRRDLSGAVLGDIVQIDSRRFAFRFSSPPFRRLSVTLHPDLCAAHLAARVATPETTTDFAAGLTEALEGASVAAIRKEPGERVVEIDFDRESGSAGTVVFELLGKAGNLLLLDGERRIVRFALEHASAFRRPKPGDPYAPPPARGAGDDSPPMGSRLLAREVEARRARGEEAGRAVEALVARIRGGPWDPVLYTPRPAGQIGERDDLPASGCFAAPFPMLCGEGLAASRFPTANEAAAAHAELALRHLLFRDLRNALAGLVKAERGRAEKLAASLREEAAGAAEAGGVRRRGEMLLASLATARKMGDEVEVTDFWDAAQPRIRIPIDPRLDLRANAEALFRRARKLDRAASVVAMRLAATAGRQEALAAFAARLEAAGGTEALEAIEADLGRSGLVRVFRKSARRELGRRPDFMKVREYRTSDGWTVLVGKSGAENDALTFKVAAPHDFWLHAAGRPGAHVVVRNPKRARELPETALREAAALAAWFSRGDRGGEVDVHWTRRKEVRKGRGMSPGMVMLRAFRTVRVRPAAPGGHAGEEEP